MKITHKVAFHVCIAAFVLDIYAHQLLLALLVVGCAYLNYLGMSKES